ncbi:MAG TPA: hypothetical protein VFX70_06585, partial [Mycobacteriales bacterium]|nr:hypothetical protein [Mycobacteriales bacterium]
VSPVNASRPDRPVMIPQISCYADGGCYIADTGSQAAGKLAGLPALRRAHDQAALGPPSPADTIELLATAADLALAAGGVQRMDGYWLCPDHAEIYLDSEPRRFTIRECIHRHRLRHTG